MGLVRLFCFVLSWALEDYLKHTAMASSSEWGVHTLPPVQHTLQIQIKHTLVTAHIYTSSTSDQKATMLRAQVVSQKGIPEPSASSHTWSSAFSWCSNKELWSSTWFKFPCESLKIFIAKYFVHSWRNESLSLVVHRAPVWSFCQEQGDADSLAKDMQNTESKTQITAKIC